MIQKTTAPPCHTIPLHTGGEFDFCQLTNPDQIQIEDIAYGLSNLCRYTGQCPFYSVAEHCVLCCNYAQQIVANDPRFALRVLLHDASEAYLGDVSKPLKQMLPAYKSIERMVERAIEERFGLWMPEAGDREVMHLQVKAIDEYMAEQEKRQIFDLAGGPVLGWMPSEAKEKFTMTFRQLMRAIDA